MIRTLFYVSVALLCLSSCVTNSYEKAIADWVQTDNDGTWTDLKFEMIEMIETTDVTVADSLHYLENKSDKLQAFIKKADNPRALIKTPFSSYAKAKDDLKKVEAMKNTYMDRDTAEVLGKLLKCKYAIVPPILNTRQEKTETFFLNPKMDKCIGRMRQK